MEALLKYQWTKVAKLPSRYELVLDFYLQGVGNNEIRMTIIREDRAVLQQVLAGISACVDLAVERTPETRMLPLC